MENIPEVNLEQAIGNWKNKIFVGTTIILKRNHLNQCSKNTREGTDLSKYDVPTKIGNMNFFHWLWTFSKFAIKTEFLKCSKVSYNFRLKRTFSVFWSSVDFRKLDFRASNELFCKTCSNFWKNAKNICKTMYFVVPGVPNTQN